MSSLSINPMVTSFPPSDIERLKGSPGDSLDDEKARLRKATKEFESFFMYYLLKTMRKTVPESPFLKDSPLANNLGKDIFNQMFDMELAKEMADGGPRSLANMLYKSVEGLIEAKQSDSMHTPSMLPLKGHDKGPVKIEQEPITLPESEEKFKEIETRKMFAPISMRPSTAHGDRIIAKYGEHIDRAAKLTSLDPALIYSVIKVESNGDASAVSDAGARGLMQLVDSTARDYGVTKVFDPGENIRAGSSFLKKLLDRFGDIKLALAAYNAGPGNVRKYGGIPPFKETQQYIRKVTDTLAAAERLFAPKGPKAESIRTDN